MALELKQTLDEFVKRWNSEHARFTFTVQKVTETNRPVTVEVRYSAAKYQDTFSTKRWKRLKYTVEAMSHNTMFVVSDEYLFESGIVSIAVASSNHNYSERIVVGVLRWIGESFFPT